MFWQAPDADRLLAGWYVHGTRVIDFSDPAAPQEIGWFEPSGADTWAAKPHRGHIFTGAGWPADAPPADDQRLKWNGFAAPPVADPPPATPRRFGRVRARVRLRVPGRRGARRRLVVSFVDAGAAVVGRARVVKPAGRRVGLKLSGVAAAGRYRFVVRAGRRVLARGRFRVRPASGVTLPDGRVIAARVR